MTSPRYTWDWGTAYDLFISLEVLHNPAEFGVRAAWAAGVRARLPAAEREILEQSQALCPLPLHWLYTLPEPKDAITVLWALNRVSPDKRLALLALVPDTPANVAQMLQSVSARGSWDEQDLEVFGTLYQRMGRTPPPGRDLANILGWWVRAEEFGERYLEALRAYHQVFFAEEEKRLRLVLQEALARAQDLAERRAPLDLLEELSQVRLAELTELDELVVVPSYWNTPRVIFARLEAGRAMWVFGARPTDVSLVPGEVVPGAMLQALKALSDPTRLRILQYLNGEPLTSAELARRLRLRAQTVAHHLKILRLAGLVHITTGDLGPENHYSLPAGAIADIYASLESFMEQGKNL